MMTFETKPSGAFNLMNANQYFGGWLTTGKDQSTIAMAFPVEGWQTSAAVLLRQEHDLIKGEVYGDEIEQQRAWQQGLSALSLDESADGWQAVGDRDPVIGDLQARFQHLRPVLFHSPYEAAAAFVIGHRISIEQGRAIRQAMAYAVGDCMEADDLRLYAFPRPEVLLALSSFAGLSEEKIRRLHGVAEAALTGRLDRAYLRSLPTEEALTQLRTLRGVGDFFSQAILYRGAGFTDVLPDDATTRQAVQQAYGLPELPDYAEVLARAETWRPYRMWAAVLLHVWFRRGDRQSLRQTATSPTQSTRPKRRVH